MGYNGTIAASARGPRAIMVPLRLQAVVGPRAEAATVPL